MCKKVYGCMERGSGRNCVPGSVSESICVYESVEEICECVRAYE